MNHIVVIGFMGSGKTRVGKRLSRLPSLLDVATSVLWNV